ncbi:MAG: glycosyltransferase family 39 protein [Candidatus Eremiobacteraeota bacterium]|nr:glycosyltransferase family 39 protein [Candidatus Eremiobacteraeota bacterium]
MRSATLWAQVWDWDVGLYLVVAREVVQGHLPYVTAWEYRPPGLFFLLGLGLAIFRSPGVTMAALGIIAVSTTSLALYRTGRLFSTHGRIVGGLAAVLYATISIEDDGLATNTELLFAPFLCWAVYLVMRTGVSQKSFDDRLAVLVGFLLAGALQMKLMVVPEAAFVVLLAALWVRCDLRRCAIIVGVLLLPFAVEGVLYAARGHFAEFLDANALATMRRAGVATSAPRDNLQRILAQPWVLMPASLLVLVAAFASGKDRDRPGRALVAVLWVWLAVEIATLLAVREFNDHQFLQVLPPLVLLAAYGGTALGAWLRAPRVVPAIIAIVAFGLHGYYQIVSAARLAYHRGLLHDAGWRGTHLDRIAERLRMVPIQERRVFVVSENPILYVLADAPLPTRYPFSFYLTDAEMWPLTGVDGRVEVRRILAARPQYIVRSDSQFHVDPAVNALVWDALQRDYRPVATEEHATIFRRRGA